MLRVFVRIGLARITLRSLLLTIVSNWERKCCPHHVCSRLSHSAGSVVIVLYRGRSCCHNCARRDETEQVGNQLTTIRLNEQPINEFLIIIPDSILSSLTMMGSAERFVTLLKRFFILMQTIITVPLGTIQCWKNACNNTVLLLPEGNKEESTTTNVFYVKKLLLFWKEIEQNGKTPIQSLTETKLRATGRVETL